MDKYTHDRDDPRIAEEQAARAERCAAAAAVADIFFFVCCLRLQNFNFFVMSLSLFFQIKSQFYGIFSLHPPRSTQQQQQKKIRARAKKKIHIV